MRRETLVSVQYDTIPELEEVWNECTQNSNEVITQYSQTSAHLLYYLMRRFFSKMLSELDQVQTVIDKLEEKVFTGHEKEIFNDITLLKRDILDYSRALKPQRIILETLFEQGSELYGASARPFLSALLSEYTRVANLLENHKEALDALYDTTSSQLVTKTNEIMRVRRCR